MRPSGHEAASWHAERLGAAEARDEERQSACDPTLPAPWPSRPKVRRPRPKASGQLKASAQLGLLDDGS